MLLDQHLICVICWMSFGIVGKKATECMRTESPFLVTVGLALSMLLADISPCRTSQVLFGSPSTAKSLIIRQFVLSWKKQVTGTYHDAIPKQSYMRSKNMGKAAFKSFAACLHSRFGMPINRLFSARGT